MRTHPAWPVNALIVGYPLWWALGIADFIFAILAIPMVLRMYGWRARGRTIKAPPWFGIWLLFMLWVLAGVVMLKLNAPDTIPGSVGTRILSYGQRTANYAGVTVLLLYVGNLTELELPRLRLARMLGLLAIVTIAGGVAGVLWPHFQYNSPFLYLLPHRLQTNGFIQDMMVPGFSEVQNLLGTAQGRPKAPFDYTNIWGDCLSILVPWLIVGWWSLGTRRQRQITALALVAAVVPAVYSLNRGHVGRRRAVHRLRRGQACRARAPCRARHAVRRPRRRRCDLPGDAVAHGDLRSAGQRPEQCHPHVAVHERDQGRGVLACPRVRRHEKPARQPALDRHRAHRHLPPLRQRLHRQQWPALAAPHL